LDNAAQLYMRGAKLNFVEIHLFCGYIFEWWKAKRRTGYSNGQSQCSKACFAIFGCYETKIVEKSKALSFRLHPHLVWPWVLGNDRKNTIASASVRNEIFEKNQGFEGVTIFDKVRSSEIRKYRNIESLFLRIERSQLIVWPCKQNASIGPLRGW